MGKKNKFDLTALVKNGYLAEGEILYFVSNSDCTCVIEKTPTNEYKLKENGGVKTVHTVCVEWLGTEPPGPANKWLRNEGGETLYELWQQSLEDKQAA